MRLLQDQEVPQLHSEEIDSVSVIRDSQGMASGFAGDKAESDSKQGKGGLGEAEGGKRMGYGSIN